MPELPIVIQSAKLLVIFAPEIFQNKQAHTHHTHVCLCVCVSSFSVAEVKGLGRCQRGHGEQRRGPGTLDPIFPLLEEQMFELCFSANSLL